ncbi:hypothetical protein CJ255_10050 [Candidatus Viridilinea mediisalina]|uniref:Uncharacterized protein n=1 Tax=Candidatus Viridilinea mediisalina TaxID=2024553 RepID=A0A2A6RJX0_9CHLR|nr:hypothetical protein CJ255_10050 [Candidatus Viridilinea mediisalina]
MGFRSCLKSRGRTLECRLQPAKAGTPTQNHRLFRQPLSVSPRPRALAPSRPRVLAPSRPRALASSRPRALAPSRPRVLAAPTPSNAPRFAGRAPRLDDPESAAQRYPSRRGP